MDVLHHLKLPLENPVLIFSLILFIILFAPILLNRLRIPPIIGLIIAGALIGPHGFNLMLRDSSIVLFGTVGLLYIMFLAGLEIDMADFIKNKYKSLQFGLLTFSIPMTLGTLSGYYILRFPIYSSILLASIFASHTLIAYTIASRFGVIKNRAVNITVGGTIITDTLALLVLAIMVGVVKGDSDEMFWIQMAVSFIVFSGLVLFGFPFVSRWFFKKQEDPVSQYIYVLGMVFLAAFLAELSGLEPIIGAFLAGLALNRLIPHTSALMNRIEFAGNALFIPIFLIGVGMLIDFKVLFKGPEALIVAGLMSTLAMVAKFLAAWISKYRFKFTKDEFLMMFGLSSAHAAAGLAAVLIGYNTPIGYNPDGTMIRLLNEDVLNGTIIMILITCTISSFVVNRAARNLALTESQDEDEEVDESAVHTRTLIPLAHEDTIESLIQFSLMTHIPKTRNEYYALHVRTDENTGKAGERLLERAQKTGAAMDHQILPITRYDINISNGILYSVKEKDISDIVLGMHTKTGFIDTEYGTVLETIIAKTSNTLFILKLQQPVTTLKKFVVVVPERAEFETGFIKWVAKLHALSMQLNSEIIFYTEKETQPKIVSILHSVNHNLPVYYKQFDEWNDFLVISRDIAPDDLFIIVSARKNTISYNPLFEKTPKQLSRYFANQNTIILFPEQHTESELEHRRMDGSIDDIIEDNLKRIDSLGKYVKKMIKGN
jgi:Kef-type K+ transport system membrane component KefB